MLVCLFFIFVIEKNFFYYFFCFPYQSRSFIFFIIDLILDFFFYIYFRYGNVKYHAGGSALNSCRILLSLGEDDVIFFGGIGNDKNGTILKEILNDQGLDECLQVFNDYNTGTCICLINGANRCLCANIGASLHFQSDFIDKMHHKIKFQPHIENFHQVFYTEGYFLPEKFAVCQKIYNSYCKDTKNLFAINVNASYICETFPEQIMWLVENGDLVFSNYWELSALTQICNFPNNDITIEYFFSKYQKENKTKLMIITKGDENIQAYYGNYNRVIRREFPVHKLPKDKIVDTTGAGDSFVAGFFYAFFRNKLLEDCINFGSDVAAKVITQIGCVLPKETPEIENTSNKCS